jgi:predicted glycoside hydrolase/deacetylase ChbG (UPF0249 family)
VLIVNADDWGLDSATTDAIAECWRARAISSASAMVWMEDSERAAELALREELPVGLHLNLVQPLTGADVPAPARERHAALARANREGFSHARLWLYDPRLAAATRAAVSDQLARFHELYGREPTHVDGHRHFHIAPNARRVLPRGIRVRGSYTYLPGERPAASRALRRLRNALIARRFATTDWFFDLRELHPALGGDMLDDKLGLAASASVEVMTHPGRRDEYDVLMSPEWRAALDREPPVSYGALGAS